MLAELYERERSHTASLGGELDASLEPGLRARITALDLKRIVSNLIETPVATAVQKTAWRIWS